MGEKNIVVILSGGIDSTTLLYWARKTISGGLLALSFFYGQKHSRELEYARLICKAAGVSRDVVDISGLQECLKGSALTDPDVELPYGEYETRTMGATVVPNRNMIMLAVAAAYSISHGMDTLAYGAHAGDHVVYADCRPAFIVAMTEALRLAHDEPLELLTPFRDLTKAEIVAMGERLEVPYGLTYSCYAGRELHCGRCATCLERRGAFELAGVADPTRYEENA